MGFLAVFRIQGCFHWLFSPIRSRVMADRNFASHNCDWRGRWSLNYPTKFVDMVRPGVTWPFKRTCRPVVPKITPWG